MYFVSSNLTNKYNPQEQAMAIVLSNHSSNLTNKYNPQEPDCSIDTILSVQILPINTILKNYLQTAQAMCTVQILPINTILKNWH